MNPIPASLLVAVMVAFAKWRKGETIGIDNVIGVAGVALGLSIIAQMDRDFAKAFGLLVVVGVLFGHATSEGEIPVLKQVGLG